MKRPPNSGFLLRERRLLSEKKALLPVHAGMSRYQAALDDDRNYRQMILAAFALALFAGSGFGDVSREVGPVRIALLCLAAAGIALRAIAYRFPRSELGKSLVEGSAVRLVGVTIGGFGVLGTFLGGLSGLLAFLLVAAVTGITLILNKEPRLRPFGYVCAAVALILSIVGTLGFGKVGASPVGSIVGLAIGILVVANCLSSNRSQTSEMQPAMILTSLSTLGWVTLTVGSNSGFPMNIALTALGCAGVALIERAISIRSSFAPVVVVLVLLHLSGYVGSLAHFHRPMAPQIVILLLEFGLVCMAGYRHAVATLALNPIATYRSSPQCLVPTLDHAWDHPLKIDAA